MEWWTKDSNPRSLGLESTLPITILLLERYPQTTHSKYKGFLHLTYTYKHTPVNSAEQLLDPDTGRCCGWSIC